jgi:16S rRNA (uracil1498-N3)-methyltransferase
VTRRRVHIDHVLSNGPVRLSADQAHHLRDVLRLKEGDPVEVFDDAGNAGEAAIEQCGADYVVLRVQKIRTIEPTRQIVIASAVPKGDRADWMIEKLSELGVHRFTPLMTARSVVHPKGASKRDRWLRLATESAKQSRRSGVMQIDELTSLENALAQIDFGYVLTTESGARSMLDIPQSTIATRQSPICLLIGPEGGWTDQELDLFRARNLTGVRLTETILRVETAAVAAAAVIGCLLVHSSHSSSGKTSPP